MIKTKRIMASLFLSGVVFVLAPFAYAATNDTPSSSPASPPTNDSVPASTLPDRITDYKAKLTTQPTTAQQVLLKARCKAAQVTTTALAKTVADNHTSRDKAYQEIAKSVDSLVKGLKETDFVTKTIESHQKKFADQLKSYNSSYSSYKATLSDLNDVDCVADPIAYKAILESARTNLIAIREEVSAIRSHLTDTLQPELTKAKAALSSDNSSDSSARPTGSNSEEDSQ